MRLAGDLNLVRPLGASELGERHLAVASVDGERVSCVVDILDPVIVAQREAIEVLLIEVAMARRLVSPSIEPILGAGRDRSPGHDGAEVVWVARRQEPGWTLEELLRLTREDAEQLLAQACLWTAAQAARALEVAHRHGVLHGALAPDALALRRDGPRIVLKDLGMGSLLGASETRLAYRAPEMLTSGTLTPAADIYGLGMVLTSLLLGEAPFARHDPLSTRRAVLEHRLPRIRAHRPSISPEIDVLISRLCALDPSDRPRDPAEVAETLEAALGPSRALVPRLLARQLETTPDQEREDRLADMEAGLAAGSRTRLQSDTSRKRRTPSARGGSVTTRLGDRTTLGPFQLESEVETHRAAREPVRCFSAFDLDSGASVRLEVLDPEAAERNQELPADVWRELFEQKIALAGSLAHPCVARLQRHGEDESLPWAAWVPPPQPRLAEVLLNRKLPVTTVLVDLARMVEHLHARGVLACGLHTHSVRVSTHGLSIFWDLSRLAPIGGAIHPLLDRDPFSLSPELAQSRHYSPASDLFALGVIAYELLTGTRPFRGLDAWSVIEALRGKPPRAPADLVRGIDPHLSELTVTLLARNPKDRPASATEVVEALSRLSP